MLHAARSSRNFSFALSSSGIRPFGFLSFQNTKNPLKIQKTFETCNLETQVYFPETNWTLVCSSPVDRPELAKTIQNRCNIGMREGLYL